MYPSTHYYVLSLSEKTNRLYECFRGTLIDVQNQGFPVEPSTPIHNQTDYEDRLRNLLRATDRRFSHYFQQEPLRLIVVGEKRVRSVFESVTEHQDIVIGSVEGDHTATSPRDLGQIVWPIVKEAISGRRSAALNELEVAEKAQKLIVGLEAVGRHLDVGSRLFVEEDYQVKGTMRRADQTWMVSPEVDVREVIDDAVDTVIESVLAIGGSVVFMNTGSLMKQKRIALIMSGAEEL